MEKKKFCLVGSEGKMGKAIREAISGQSEIFVNITVDTDKDAADKKYIVEVNPLEVDVVINFTNPLATVDSAQWCDQYGKPLVAGTTGLSDAQMATLKMCAKRVPILWDSNMSLGVNLIDALLPQIVNILQGFEIEMVEIHNRDKKDSPSGTAERFAKTLVKAKGGEIVYGRAKGNHGNRPINEVVVHSIRAGTVPGEHTIYFIGPDEIIEIKHRALSRGVFARGALKAANWIIGQSPGFYNMNDVLGLK